MLEIVRRRRVGEGLLELEDRVYIIIIAQYLRRAKSRELMVSS